MSFSNPCVPAVSLPRQSRVACALAMLAGAFAVTTARATDFPMLTDPAPSSGSVAQPSSPGPSSAGLNSSTDWLSRFVERSAEDGIYYRSTIMLEAAGNVSGGIRRGSTVSPYLTFGADFDLEKLIGWRGAVVHATIIAEHSSGVSQKYIGGGVDVQENYAPFNVFRFMSLTLEQKLSLWAKDDVLLTVGRMGMTSYFAKNAYTCDFLNHTFCGPMYGFTQSTGTAVAPVASWGGVARLNTSKRTYVQAGAFAVDADTIDASTRIMDLGVSGIHGTDYLAEVGYESLPADRMTGHYRLGVSYLASSRNDVYLNDEGLPLYLDGGSKLQHRDEVAAYVTADQVIYRDSAISERNIALFGSYYQNFQTSEAIADTWKLGVVKTGTFPGRDSDTIGFAASEVSFTDKEIDYLSAKRAQGGGYVSRSV